MKLIVILNRYFLFNTRFCFSLSLLVFVAISLSSPALSFSAQEWIAVPAGEYEPLFVPSEADPKGLFELKENRQKEKLEKNKAGKNSQDSNLQDNSPSKIMTPVAAFSILKSPVTNQDYTLFLAKNPNWKKNKIKALFADKKYLEHWKTNETVGKAQLQKEPVVNVSWFAAEAYCESIGARLPTTDEWEYIASLDDAALRDKTILNWYSKPNHQPLDRKSPKQDDGSTAQPTITYEGKLGILDMYGKIWEWTSDFNTAMVTGESREDTSLSRSMFCGAGSIGSTRPEEYATFMRYAFRSSLKGVYSLSNLGFRCAKTEATKTDAIKTESSKAELN